MKKICCLALSLVLTAAMFTGCGCTNTNRDDASTPTGTPTTMPTIATTEAPTVPTTQATRPTMEETSDTGNGLLEDNTTGSTETTGAAAEGRSRMMPGSGNSGK